MNMTMLQSESAYSPQEHVDSKTRHAQDGTPTSIRRRIINDDDDDEPIAMNINTRQTDPKSPIVIQSGSDPEDADDNFAVLLQPARPTATMQPTATTTAGPANSAKPSQARTRRNKKAQPAIVSDWTGVMKPKFSNILSQPEHNSELDEKNQYEDEAEEDEEDDPDFLDDEADESDPEAAKQVRAASAALRNRRNWKETEFQCPLCADLRVVLTHLMNH